MQYSWGGTSDGYDRPGAAGLSMMTANTVPRWQPINYGLSSQIMSSGAQNRADFSNYHAGVESEAIKSYRQNFQS
ncbi:MAG: hypothetical protein ACPGRX_05210 [Bdellovibrionales bacterium]